MTRLWLTKMDQPFCLLVYDNHTDMQPPAFGGLLSCGGWIAAALEELENLKHVILVGPDEAAYEQVEENLKERVIFLSREKLQVMNDEERNWFLRETLWAMMWKRTLKIVPSGRMPNARVIRPTLPVSMPVSRAVNSARSYSPVAAK